MSAELFASFSTFGIIVSCIFGPPLIGGLIVAFGRQWNAKKQGRTVSPLLQFLPVYGEMRWNASVKVPGDLFFWLLLSVTFHLLALVLLGFQKNLAPILFFQAAGVLAMILGGMTHSISYFGLSFNHGLKAFLTSQPVLFLVAAGVFLTTGSFNFTEIANYPRLLVIDSPLLFAALLFVTHETERNVNETAAQGPLSALIQLAACYQTATLLLFAGYFFGHGLGAAALAAVLLYVLLTIVSYAGPNDAWRQYKAEWGWEAAFFACGLNLVWIYIKYWL